MPTVDDLVAQYNGHVFGITGPDQGQCTAVAHAWEEMLGLPIVYGNAIDTFDNAPDDLYHKELNTPDGVPAPGAIMVWDSRWGGGYGHTAVVTSANINTFDCLEQNDGDDGVTHVGRHNYADTIGWFTPRVLDAPAPAPTPEPTPTTPVPEIPVVPIPEPATPEPSPIPTAPSPAPIVPPVTGVPMQAVKDVVLSKKFLIALASVITLLANGQYLEAMTVVLTYLGIQGAIDHKNAGV
jgi:surface antigen